MQQIVNYFLDSLKSPHTKDKYEYHRIRYQNYKNSVKFTDESDTGALQANIISYLVHMDQQEGLSYSYRAVALASIKHDYSMRDIILNWIKISKFLGEKKEGEYKGYTKEQIDAMLNFADVKYQAIILTLASTGMRREALTQLKVGDFEYLDTYQLYKIKIYRGSKSAQICFTTPEAATAINRYITAKQLKPEDYFHNVEPKAVSQLLRRIAIEAGISKPHHLAENEEIGHFRGEIPAVHGLRTFCISQMKKAHVDTETSKLLTGHSIGVRSKYLHGYTEDDLLQEYLKAIDLLTIGEDHGLKIQVNDLIKQKDQEIQGMKKQIAKLELGQKELIEVLRRNVRSRIVLDSKLHPEDENLRRMAEQIESERAKKMKKVAADKLVKGTAKNVVKR
jgi:integrase